MTSRLWNPIEKFITKLNSVGPMPAVHHYTSVHGATGIFESGSLWFTERAHLNDPSEVSHGVEIATETLRDLARIDDADRLNRSAQQVFQNFRFFSASFTSRDDDPHQWRKYGDSGRGVALSFKASSFNNPKSYIDKLLDCNPTAFVCPMSYSSAELRAVIAAIIEEWNGGSIEELCDHVFMISSMFKSDCWRSEQEYRFFVHGTRRGVAMSSRYKTRDRDGGSISYLDIPIQNWRSTDDFPIYRIRVGPDAPRDLGKRLAGALLSIGVHSCIDWPNIHVARLLP